MVGREVERRACVVGVVVVIVVYGVAAVVNDGCVDVVIIDSIIAVSPIKKEDARP